MWRLPYHCRRKTKFVCVDGPEFDGHQVDFDEMLKRMGAFKTSNEKKCTNSTLYAKLQRRPTKKAVMLPGDRSCVSRMKAKERTAIPRVEMNELDANIVHIAARKK